MVYHGWTVAPRAASKAVTAVLSGRTTDPAALHRYLGELHRCSLFPKVELDKLESVAPGTNVPDGTMTFTTIVEVRAGYGQAGGPAGSVGASSVGADSVRPEVNGASEKEDVSKTLGRDQRGAFVGDGNRGGDES